MPPLADQAASAAAPAAPQKIFRLKLDGNGIYQGCEEITANDIVDGDVILDHAPDNAPGRYRWLRDEERFEALPADFVAPVIESNAQLALYGVVKALAASGLALPDVTTAWAAEYAKTIDAQGIKL